MIESFCSEETAEAIREAQDRVHRKGLSRNVVKFLMDSRGAVHGVDQDDRTVTMMTQKNLLSLLKEACSNQPIDDVLAKMGFKLIEEKKEGA